MTLLTARICTPSILMMHSGDEPLQQRSAHKAAAARRQNSRACLCVTTPAALELLNQRRWQFLGPYEGSAVSQRAAAHIAM